MHRMNANNDGKSYQHFKQGLLQLQAEGHKTWAPKGSLKRYLSQQRWRGQVECLLQANIALYKAQVSAWDESMHHITMMNRAMTRSRLSDDTSARTLHMYLLAVHDQGTGRLDAALLKYQSPLFTLGDVKSAKTTTFGYDLSILAAMNALWLLQHPSYLSTSRNATLLEALAPHCTSHLNIDIRTAFSLLQITVATTVPQTIPESKNHLHNAWKLCHMSQNSQMLAITSAVMCQRFFTGNHGEQAHKHATGTAKSTRSYGGKVWMSVGEGLLASFWGGKGDEGIMERDKAWKAGIALKRDAGLVGIHSNPAGHDHDEGFKSDEVDML